MKYCIILFLFLLGVSCINFYGQVFGFVYLVYGIGDLWLKVNGQVQGLGGVGIGLFFQYFFNLINFVSYLSLVFRLNMFFDFGVDVNYLFMCSDEVINSYWSGGFLYFSLWLRFIKGWSSILGL